MSNYYPDRWVIVKVLQSNDSPTPLYKVLAGFYGGYVGADEWRLNSGIVSFKEEKNFYRFYGYSGSAYICHKESYGFTMESEGFYNQHNKDHRLIAFSNVDEFISEFNNGEISDGK